MTSERPRASTFGGEPGRARWVVADVVRWTVALALLATAVYPGLRFRYPHYGLVVAGFPWALHRALGVYPTPRQVTVVSLAIAVHPFGGVLGFYESLWWWDDVAHLVSSALLSAVAYLPARIYHSEGPRTTPAWMPVAFAVTTALLAGVTWEVVELFVPSLIVYGPVDTLTDLVFDALGALAVVVTARWTLDPLAAAADLERGEVTRVLPGVHADGTNE